MCPQSATFFHPRAIRMPDSIGKKDLILSGELGGWPNGHFDLAFLGPVEEAFFNSFLDKKRKEAILRMVQYLQPWTRYDVYMAINSKVDLAERNFLCDEFLNKIQSLNLFITPSDLSP